MSDTPEKVSPEVVVKQEVPLPPKINTSDLVNRK